VTQSYRTAGGGTIDRSALVRFSFNGKSYTGYRGDTLASALLANGVHWVGRSWKYHRPRGIVAAGVEEPNAIVQLGTGARTVPNARATSVEIYDGLSATSVNCHPSMERDYLSIAGKFSRLLPAGFYYKTFMWPMKLWPKYERFIRKAAGLGKSPREPDPDRYVKTNAHCDVLVVGAGPAGLAAALAAGRAGARVILADEQSEFGGSLLDRRDLVDGEPPLKWVRKAVAELSALPEVRLLARSTVFGYHDHNFLTIQQRLTDHLPESARMGARERVWRVRAKRVVLATGAHERPLVFGNNDRPGVMLASAVSAYVNRYGVKPGTTSVIFTNNDSAYQTAFDLLDCGVKVAALVDARVEPRGALPAAVQACGVEIIHGAVVTDVRGSRRVEALEVMGFDGNSVHGGKRRICCDLLAVSGGWSPVVHLFAQSGGKAVWDEARACFVPGASVQAECSAGACKGSFGLAVCLSEGEGAGAEAARLTGFAELAIARPPRTDAVQEQPILPLWVVPGPHPLGRGPKQFVDLQNDVGTSDILLAAREGYRSVEHVKRYTALGFGTDQGKLGNINGMAILAKALGQDIPSTGTTAFRPNYTPITFGAIAGRDVNELFDPVRKTAIHEWHVEHGALFENVGQWKRPWYYPRPGESMHAAVARECRAVRNSVGMMDASTLGKIDIQGPDAAKLLDWMYTNAWSKLEVGRCRYGLMLDENGMVLDDGVTTRLSQQHYLMTTTTGGAARVMSWLERWLQTEWPEMKVYLTSVTDHWVTMAVAGPNSRRVVQAVCPDIDFLPGAFPFMCCREGTAAGVPARVMRISFSGELAYEINVPANYGRAVWEAAMDAGAPCDITPYGTETMHVLRAEKGYIIVGQDTDGSVTPIDLGMDWIVAKNKDFIGKRSLSRADTAREDRKHLVGLLTDDPNEVLPEGGQIVADATPAPPVPMLGHVTSSYHSPTLGRSIGLALVKGGGVRQGQRVQIPLDGGKVVSAVIGPPVFYDTEGARQNV
jgi:sarcosine oxidase, subunit alpha